MTNFNFNLSSDRPCDELRQRPLFGLISPLTARASFTSAHPGPQGSSDSVQASSAQINCTKEGATGPRPDAQDAYSSHLPVTFKMEPALDPEATQSEAVDAPDVDFDAVMDTAHLARFEFSDAGTKVLMVEWTPDAVLGLEGTGDQKESTAETGWQISWAGKSAGTFLRSDAHVEPSAAAAASDAAAAAAPRRRVFFLLPPPAPIPTTVTLTPPGGAAAIELKPLPAIFPEGFMDVETGQGTRGVLHTIWAKQRVRELEREMDAEMRANAESVGLDMASAERQWIVDTFLRPPPAPAAIQPVASGAPAPFLPRTPTGGRLGEKLKGLRLGTSPTDLAPSPTGK